MASFQYTTHQDIAKATCKCELKIQSVPFARRNNANAIWSVAFAPDRSRFAWSSGNRKIQILPWDAIRNVPIADPDLITYDKNNTNGRNPCPCADNSSNACTNCQHERHLKQEDALSKVKTVECGDMVLSLAFGSSVPGSSVPHKKLRHSNIKYHMFDYSRTELMLAIGLKSGKIKTYDIGKDSMLHLMDHKGGINDLAFSPDGSLTLISASADATLKVWDLKDDGNMVTTLKEHKKPVICCGFSPNGQVMASVGNNKQAILWDMNTCTFMHRLIGHHHDIVSCQFSPDGALLVTASWDARVCVWDPYTGSVLQELHHVFPPLPTVFAGGANNNFVRGVSFSADGSHIASICDDKYVRFWSILDVSDPQAVYPLENGVICKYNPDGSVLAAGTRGGQVKFIEAPMKVNQLQHLCRLHIRRLVQDSRNLGALGEHLPRKLLGYLAYNDLETPQMMEV